MAAYVVEVSDGGLVGADGRPEPAKLILHIGIPMKLNPGAPAPVYIIRESDAPRVVEVENGRVN